MAEDYTILPANTLATGTSVLLDVITANVLVIVGVVFLAVAIKFITRWFGKSTSKLKA